MAEVHIHILHGNDHDALDQKSAELISEQRENGMADMNLSVIDAKTVSSDDFTNIVFAAPFLVEKRVVIVSNPLSMAGGREGNQKFINLLESVPESTLLYLMIPDTIERKDWAILGKTNFLRKWAEKHPETALITTWQLPAQSQMPAWIMKKAVSRGGQFDTTGASALAAAIGNDTQHAAREIDKLLLYVDYARPVDADDVNELVSSVVSVSVFDMVDSLAVGNARVALAKMHQLLEEQEAPQLFAMIVRQFRLLIQTRDILDRHGNSSVVQKELGQVPFVADKLCRQAGAFSAGRLRKIYDSLLQLDYSFKTSQGDFLSALDLFIIDVANLLKNPSRG